MHRDLPIFNINMPNAKQKTKIKAKNPGNSVKRNYRTCRLQWSVEPPGD